MSEIPDFVITDPHPDPFNASGQTQEQKSSELKRLAAATKTAEIDVEAKLAIKLVEETKHANRLNEYEGNRTLRNRQNLNQQILSLHRAKNNLIRAQSAA